MGALSPPPARKTGHRLGRPHALLWCVTRALAPWCCVHSLLLTSCHLPPVYRLAANLGVWHRSPAGVGGDGAAPAGWARPVGGLDQHQQPDLAAHGGDTPGQQPLHGRQLPERQRPATDLPRGVRALGLPTPKLAGGQKRFPGPESIGPHVFLNRGACTRARDVLQYWESHTPSDAAQPFRLRV